MAENVKRRVAAARLAVAFVAAGTIAGATAWAQPSPPSPTAQSSAFDAFLKIDSIKGEHILDGSLHFEDFGKHEVPSYKQFKKLQAATGQHIKKAVLTRKYYPKVEIDRLFIKGESNDYVKRTEISSYIKHSEADARYLKLGDDVVLGDGSVHTATALVGAGQSQPLLSVPGMFTVDATGPTIRITNTGNSPLTHTSCGVGGQLPTAAGQIDPTESFSCATGDHSETLQVVGAGPGGGPHVATLNVSGVSPPGQNATQVTVQILIGL